MNRSPNSGDKKYSYFIIHLFSKHFPLEYVVWQKMTEKIKVENLGKKNMRLLSFIQHLLSEKNERFLLDEKQKNIIKFRGKNSATYFINNKCKFHSKLQHRKQFFQ